MIVVTGAAGFIGSAMVSYLNKMGINNLLVVDEISKSNHLNLVGKNYEKFIDRETFLHSLDKINPKYEVIFHIGARTDTTELDQNIFNHLNINYTKSLWNYCLKNNIAFIYASSAATYGNGSYGYTDDIELIPQLQPLNPYGWSKQLVDMWILKQSKTPAKWAGFKFFNVFGPNEYHKGRMASVVYHGYHQVKNNGLIKLFRSNDVTIPDGMQKRDFVYVLDVIKTMYSFYIGNVANGIYNLGSGHAHSFLDLANAVFSALELETKIEFIPMPPDLSKTYQNFTEADMHKTISAGIYHQSLSFNASIKDYINNYLIANKYY